MLHHAHETLQAEFENYRRERLESDKQFRMTIDEARDEAAVARVELAKAQSYGQLMEGTFGYYRDIVKFNVYIGRYASLEQTSQTYQVELGALRQKNAQFSASLIEYEKRYNDLQLEMRAATEKLNGLMMQNTALRQEREMWQVVFSYLY